MEKFSKYQISKDFGCYHLIVETGIFIYHTHTISLFYHLAKSLASETIQRLHVY